MSTITCICTDFVATVLSIVLAGWPPAAIGQPVFNPPWLRDPHPHGVRVHRDLCRHPAAGNEGNAPPHALVYDEYATVDGLPVPVRDSIYEDGSVDARCAISNRSFSEPFDVARMEMLAEAVVDASSPDRHAE